MEMTDSAGTKGKRIPEYDLYARVLRRCTRMAMQKLHAALIREGACCTGACCDYCIVGDQNPMTKAYELVKRENGLLVSVKKETK